MDAFIFDKPLLTYYMLKDDQTCELTMLKEDNIVPFDYGVAFHVNFPAPNLWAFSTGILQAQVSALSFLHWCCKEVFGHAEGRASRNAAEAGHASTQRGLRQLRGLPRRMAREARAVFGAGIRVCWGASAAALPPGGPGASLQASAAMHVHAVCVPCLRHGQAASRPCCRV